MKSVIKLILVLTAVLGALFAVACTDREDRSLVSTFMAFKPNTVLVYEITINETLFNQLVFFDHIDGETAQRTTRMMLPNSEIVSHATTETVMLTDTMFLSDLVGGQVNRGNHIVPLFDEDGRQTPHVMTILRGPLAVGQSWTLYADNRPNNLRFRVHSLDARVVTPAGTFRCLEIRSVGAQGINSVQTDFFAPGIGLVKQVIENDGVRTELILTQIIENTGFNEVMSVHFPNNGEFEVTQVTVSHSTNDNALYNYFSAANKLWEDAFGFAVEPAWFNRNAELFCERTRYFFPRFDFNESFVEAMNDLADEETERAALFSVAATLASVFRASPNHNARFLTAQAHITVNNGVYESNRVRLPFDERIVIWEYMDEEGLTLNELGRDLLNVFFTVDGEIETSRVILPELDDGDALDTIFAMANEFWEDAFGFTFEPAWLIGTSEYFFGMTGDYFPLFDFSEPFLAALNNVADEETEWAVLTAIVSTLTPVFWPPPHPNPFFSAGLAHVTINGEAFASNRIEIQPDERIFVWTLQ